MNRHFVLACGAAIAALSMLTPSGGHRLDQTDTALLGGSLCTPPNFTDCAIVELQNGDEHCWKCREQGSGSFRCTVSHTDKLCVDIVGLEGCTACGTCLEDCGGYEKDYVGPNCGGPFHQWTCYYAYWHAEEQQCTASCP